MGVAKNFDYDLAFGEMGEAYWLSQLHVRSEVKTDRKAHETRNVVVEFESRGSASGITTTQADQWVHIIEKTGVIVMIPTARIKRLIQKNKFERIVDGGDEKTSKLFLFKPDVLLHEVV